MSFWFNGSNDMDRDSLVGQRPPDLSADSFLSGSDSVRSVDRSAIDTALRHVFANL